MTVLGAARPLPVGGRGGRRQASVSRVVALPRPAAQPRARSGAATQPRAAVAPRRLSRASRVAARAHPARSLIGGVLIAFLIGLIYLAQTVNLAATNFEIDQLAAQREDLYRQVQTAETTVLSWGSEPTVLNRARQLGLDQLATKVRLSAH